MPEHVKAKPSGPKDAPANISTLVAIFSVVLTGIMFGANALAMLVLREFGYFSQFVIMAWTGVLFTQYALPAIFGIFAGCHFFTRMVFILAYAIVLSIPVALEIGMDNIIEDSVEIALWGLSFASGVVVGAQVPLWINRTYFEWQILPRGAPITKPASAGVGSMVTATSVIACLFGLSHLAWSTTLSGGAIFSPAALLFPTVGIGLLMGCFVLVPSLMVALPEEPRWRQATVFYIFYFGVPAILFLFVAAADVRAVPMIFNYLVGWSMFPASVLGCLYVYRSIGFRLVTRRDRLAMQKEGMSADFEELAPKHPLDD